MRERILVIEADPTVTMRVRSALEEEGYEVSAAADGAEGLRQVLIGQPHLIILGVSFPGDGWKTCHRIRELSDVPMILLAASDQEEDVVKGLGLGADDCLTKPFSLHELMARVRAILRRVNSLPSEGRPYLLWTVESRDFLEEPEED